jgi:hypothetical protein
MYGSGAVEPYKTWFNTIKTVEDGSGGSNLPTLALLYLATGDNNYMTKFVTKVSGTGVITYDDVIGIDLMYDHIDDNTKRWILERKSTYETHYNEFKASK